MSNVKIDELQKLYKDYKVNSFLQELCEYFATKEDYEENSYEEEIEPAQIVESVYLLFCLERRSIILEDFGYIRKRYPNLFSAIKDFYEKLLLSMNTTALFDELSDILSRETGIDASTILEKADDTSALYSDMSEAMDNFYSWMKSNKRNIN